MLGVVHLDEAVGRDREGVGRQQDVVNRELATSVAVNSRNIPCNGDRVVLLDVYQTVERSYWQVLSQTVGRSTWHGIPDCGII